MNIFEDNDTMMERKTMVALFPIRKHTHLQWFFINKRRPFNANHRRCRHARPLIGGIFMPPALAVCAHFRSTTTTKISLASFVCTQNN